MKPVIPAQTTEPKGARPAPGSDVFSERVWAEIARGLSLTRRELQIVRSIFDDRTEAAMADELGISVHTVHTYTERLRRKLGVMDRAALVVEVVREFLKLTGAPGSSLPPVCGFRSGGLCHRRD